MPFAVERFVRDQHDSVERRDVQVELGDEEKSAGPIPGPTHPGGMAQLTPRHFFWCETTQPNQSGSTCASVIDVPFHEHAVERVAAHLRVDDATHQRIAAARDEVASQRAGLRTVQHRTSQPVLALV